MGNPRIGLADPLPSFSRVTAQYSFANSVRISSTNTVASPSSVGEILDPIRSTNAFVERCANVYDGFSRPLVWERLMPVVCPICKSLAQQLLGTGYATAFRCVIHNNFKVSDTVSEQSSVRRLGNGALSEEAISERVRASGTVQRGQAELVA